MLSLGLQFINKPILSLRTGTQLGKIREVIVNPDNLKIEGWYVDDDFHHETRILLSQDVRDIISQGFVVNDQDSLTSPNELVRLRQLLDLRFEVIGKPVKTVAKKRLGKVTDYAFEKDAFFIQKLYVGQSLVTSFSGGSAIVDRTQIVEITDREILVNDATVPGKVMAMPIADSEPAPAS
jgi:uncharacterized protein YrrD